MNNKYNQEFVNSDEIDKQEFYEFINSIENPDLIIRTNSKKKRKHSMDKRKSYLLRKKTETEMLSANFKINRTASLNSMPAETS